MTTPSAGEELPAPAGEKVEVVPHTGSISRRLMLIAAGWIGILLLVGGIAGDRTLTGLIE